MQSTVFVGLFCSCQYATDKVVPLGLPRWHWNGHVEAGDQNVLCSGESLHCLSIVVEQGDVFYVINGILDKKELLTLVFALDLVWT